MAYRWYIQRTRSSPWRPAASNAAFLGDVTNNSMTGFTVAGGSSAIIFGDFSGAGIHGSGTVQFEGLVNIGFSPFAASFGGDLTFGAASELVIELAGYDVGRYDSFSIAGDAVLLGELGVELLDGFSLSAGDEFLIFDIAGNRYGEFRGLRQDGLVGVFGGTELFIDYFAGDGNDVALYSVPTPGVVSLVAMGGLAASRRRRGA